MRRFKILPLALAVMFLAVISAGVLSARTKSQYVTWQSLEPDIWASVWLIKTHIDSNAEISMLPPGEKAHAGTSFGIPDSRYQRDSASSVFEKLLPLVDEEDQALQRMGRLMTALETLSWEKAADPMTSVVESSYRLLQDRFDREYVPVTCYGQFFSEVYSGLEKEENPAEMSVRLDALLESAKSDCQWNEAYTGGGMRDSRSGDIPLVPVEDILAAISEGKKVVFVDTREAIEFDAGHIPGAVNIKLREVDGDVASPLADADMVVSYCLKDFRGYEVARKLRQYGVNTAVTMNPHGYVGWKSLGLPSTSVAINDMEGLSALTACAGNAEACLKGERL